MRGKRVLSARQVKLGGVIFLSLSLGDIDLAKVEEILNQVYENEIRRQRGKRRGGFSDLTLNSTVQAIESAANRARIAFVTGH